MTADPVAADPVLASRGRGHRADDLREEPRAHRARPRVRGDRRRVRRRRLPSTRDRRARLVQHRAGVRGRPRHDPRARQRLVHGPHHVGRRRRGQRRGLAAIAVASGQAESVIAFRSRNRSKAASYGDDRNQGGRPWEKVGAGISDGRQWHNPFGVAAPAQEMALIARRHMALFGTTAEQFGMQAVAATLPRVTQPARDHARADHARRLARGADHRRPDPARRLLARERRCDRDPGHDGRSARATSRKPPAVVLAQAMGAGPIHVALADYFRTSSSFDRPRPRRPPHREAALRARGARASRRRRGDDLRPLHDGGAALARAVRLLRDRRGWPDDRVGRDGVARWRAAGEHARRLERRGLHPRREPRPRSGAPDPRHLDVAGRGC